MDRAQARALGSLSDDYDAKVNYPALAELGRGTLESKVSAEEFRLGHPPLGIIPYGTGCDFGPCIYGFQEPITDSVIITGIAACLANPTCAAIVLTSLVAIAQQAANLPLSFSQRGDRNVADTGIMNEVYDMIRRGLAKNVCEALKILYDQSTGLRRVKIKRTQKAKGCRGH